MAEPGNVKKTPLRSKARTAEGGSGVQFNDTETRNERGRQLNGGNETSFVSGGDEEGPATAGSVGVGQQAPALNFMDMIAGKAPNPGQVTRYLPDGRMIIMGPPPAPTPFLVSGILNGRGPESAINTVYTRACLYVRQIEKEQIPHPTNFVEMSMLMLKIKDIYLDYVVAIYQEEWPQLTVDQLEQTKKNSR